MAENSVECFHTCLLLSESVITYILLDPDVESNYLKIYENLTVCRIPV